MMNAACNSNKKGGLFSRPKLRGKDLNLRPLGYEPNELPLLHPAVLLQYIGTHHDASMDIEAGLGSRFLESGQFRESSGLFRKLGLVPGI